MLDVSLPQGAMTLTNQNVVIQNSQFINLSFFASAVFILQTSNVVFKNATFTGGQNAVAAAIFGNNSQVSLPCKGRMPLLPSQAPWQANACGVAASSSQSVREAWVLSVSSSQGFVSGLDMPAEGQKQAVCRVLLCTCQAGACSSLCVLCVSPYA